MKLSKVIAQLKELKKEYGDVKVCAGIECKDANPEARDPFKVFKINGVRDVIDIDGIFSGAGSIVLILSDKLQTY